MSFTEQRHYLRYMDAYILAVAIAAAIWLLTAHHRAVSTSVRLPPPAKPRRPNPLSNGFLTMLLICLLVIAMALGYPPELPDTFAWILRAMSFAGAVLLLWWHRREQYLVPLAASHRNPLAIDHWDDHPQLLQWHASRTELEPDLESMQSQLLIWALLSPSLLRQRIVERYTLSSRTLKQTVTIDMVLPKPARDLADASENTEIGGVAVPVLVLLKGALMDDLRIRAADGANLPTLAHHEYLQLAARTLRALLVFAYGPLDRETHKVPLEAEERALRTIMRRRSGDKTPEDDGEQALLALVDDHRSGRLPVPKPAFITTAAALVRILARHYVVLAAVPYSTGGRLTVTYERLANREIPPKANGRPKGNLWRDNGSYRLVLPTDLGCTCASYHLIVDGPEGIYLVEQDAPELDAYVRMHWKAMKSERDGHRIGPMDLTPPPYYRFGSRRGQSFAHFYTRFTPIPRAHVLGGRNAPKLRLQFLETPPGESFRAAISSTAAALLIWLIGFVMSRGMDTVVGFELESDAPAILLVFPALAATWLGIDRKLQSLIGSSIGSAATILTTIIVSVAASGLFMLNVSDITYLRWDNPGAVNLLGIHHLSWTVLTVIAFANALVAAYLCAGDWWQYSHFTRHHDRDKEMTENLGT